MAKSTPSAAPGLGGVSLLLVAWPGEYELGVAPDGAADGGDDQAGAFVS